MAGPLFIFRETVLVLAVSEEVLLGANVKAREINFGI